MRQGTNVIEKENEASDSIKTCDRFKHFNINNPDEIIDKIYRRGYQIFILALFINLRPTEEADLPSSYLFFFFLKRNILLNSKIIRILGN